MPAERAPMRKVREVLRLRHALGVSERQIAITIGISRSTVGEYLRRAAVIAILFQFVTAFCAVAPVTIDIMSNPIGSKLKTLLFITDLQI